MFDKYQASLSVSTDTLSQPKLDTMFAGRSQERYGNKHEVQLKITNSIVNNLIIGFGLPISVVESDFFVKFMHDVDPKYHIPSRYHVTSKLIPLARQKRVAEMKKHLDVAKHIGLTVDIWTDRCMHSFVGVTAHTFVNMEAQCHLLHFGAFKGSHTGSRIAAELEKLIEDSNIKGKVVYIVSDNASNMRKAFELLCAKLSEDDDDDDDNTMSSTDDPVDDETLFEDLHTEDADIIGQVIDKNCLSRMSCFAHSIQLAIKDGMDKCSTVRSIMAKCSKLANCCHQSEIFRDQFENKFGQGRSIPSTNATRWSSTFHQLSAIFMLWTNNC